MCAYDISAPAQGHQALSDIDALRNNTLALREHEASAGTYPTNPAAGQFYFDSSTGVESIYMRTNSGTWLYLFKASDPPAKSSDLTTHINTNITSAVAVHGIKQGTGNGFDADKLDGQEASDFAAASHVSATSGIHGAGGGVILSAPTTVPFLMIASTAPAGWTQKTDWNDRVIRVVSGAGGGTGGGWAISGLGSVGDHTHSTPNHSHDLAVGGVLSSNGDTGSQVVRAESNKQLYEWGSTSGGSVTIRSIYGYTATSGGGVSGAAGGHAHSGDGTWRPSYVDVIAVTKNA